MRERARTVGDTLDAGPRADGGFEVTAVLPLTKTGTGTTGTGTTGTGTTGTGTVGEGTG
ncbi:hypothetical protein STAFG_0290 [Streptomyces afghaniensis 772]|uniref:Uncharacterized protein n=1 Tax=Streptomyces afghaniensis 772 TaxID=1283301 RepID=S4NVT1_9ACTN|nr:hypothetical protein STAFG_0290 [Streptomyces afghaniensis 772]